MTVRDSEYDHYMRCSSAERTPHRHVADPLAKRSRWLLLQSNRLDDHLPRAGLEGHHRVRGILVEAELTAHLSCRIVDVIWWTPLSRHGNDSYLCAGCGQVRNRKPRRDIGTHSSRIGDGIRLRRSVAIVIPCPLHASLRAMTLTDPPNRTNRPVAIRSRASSFSAPAKSTPIIPAPAARSTSRSKKLSTPASSFVSTVP
jgi:hypothetical protein